MEEYGILAWEVLERDDEIFDDSDMKDEHKVMHSLWARWIYLNRNFFISNFNKGIITFVRDNFLMILEFW